MSFGCFPLVSFYPSQLAVNLEATSMLIHLWELSASPQKHSLTPSAFGHLRYDFFVSATTISNLDYYTRLFSGVPASSLVPLQFIPCIAVRVIFIMYRPRYLPLLLRHNLASLPCPTRPCKE
uniref:Uncharacterized protein n=1 Tax=Rousettus aegyptiacus TaxID=9407 RepID=A0A7J8DHV7_ROUAE|nr:hypothetical protein HJG63_008583 [Rousettus aegyptiacus]